MKGSVWNLSTSTTLGRNYSRKCFIQATAAAAIQGCFRHLMATQTFIKDLLCEEKVLFRVDPPFIKLEGRGANGQTDAWLLPPAQTVSLGQKQVAIRGIRRRPLSWGGSRHRHDRYK